MKRFYATLALLGAFTIGASAQMRQCDIQLFTIAPMNASGAYDLNCATDSVTQTMFLVNAGPDNILPEDTILINDPRTTGIDYYYALSGDTILANDTIVVFNSKVAISNIKWLTQPDENNQLQEVLRADFVSGSQYIWTNLAMLSGYAAANANSEDPDNTNNSGQTLVSWTCSGTGVKNVNYNKTALNIFPNPASNQISFTNEFTTTAVAVVKITDIAGRVIKSIDLGKQNAGTKTYNVDIAELHNGMYYIELVTDKTRSISKFTKN